MWHASVSVRPQYARRMPEYKLRPVAYRLLAGVGDARLGEWTEYNGSYLHVRRRLTPAEAAQVNAPVDLRGTAEGWERFEKLGGDLIPLAREMAVEELGIDPRRVAG